MIPQPKNWTTERKDVKKGHSIIIEKQDNYSENNGGVRDIRLDRIGEMVSVPEYGEGIIRGVEIFPGTTSEERYIIEITENYAKPILKSLFPDNKMAFWNREFTTMVCEADCDSNNCCDCGDTESGCGCSGCYSCNACEVCINEYNR